MGGEAEERSQHPVYRARSSSVQRGWLAAVAFSLLPTAVQLFHFHQPLFGLPLHCYSQCNVMTSNTMAILQSNDGPLYGYSHSPSFSFLSNEMIHCRGL